MTHIQKTAVVIVNTGSPAAPTKEAVARYLAEFLGDRRVVEMHPWLWKPILHGIIIPRRAQASADRYKTVWTQEGSPLMAICARIAAGMQQALGDGYCVDWAMCYGTRHIPEVLERIVGTAPARIIILPLFAQYATQTSAAVFDQVDAFVRRTGCTVPIEKIEDYHDHPDYIEALAQSVEETWKERGKIEGNAKLMLSFHGVPLASSLRGDPYEKQCRRTAELLVERLGLACGQWELVFQSKFGRAKWLEPAAVDVAARLGGDKLERLDVLCPGFSSDCLETLEEIATELKGIYEDAGGRGFGYIGCLNDTARAVELYARIVREKASA